MTNQNWATAYIFYEKINKWGHITGACLDDGDDGKFKLIFTSEDKEITTIIDLITLNKSPRSYCVTPLPRWGNKKNRTKFSKIVQRMILDNVTEQRVKVEDIYWDIIDMYDAINIACYNIGESTNGYTGYTKSTKNEVIFYIEFPYWV